jgi:F0F1-type ATP synthase membrane subunit b/b'
LIIRMKTHRLSLFLPFAIVLCLGLTPAAVSAWAQEEAGARSEEFGAEAGEVGEEGEEEGGLLAVALRWINFAILFGGLGYMLRQPAAEFFETRRQAILGGLEKSRAAQQDADERIADVNGRLAKLSTEIAGIVSDAKESARNERDRIVADAKKEVDRALERSQSEVERLAGGMELEIRSLIADRVVQSAEEKLRSRLTEQDHGRMIRRAVDAL